MTTAIRAKPRSLARFIPLRRLARVRRRVVWLILLSPTIVVLTMDLARRGARVVQFRGFYEATYLASIVESTLVWGALLYAACRQRGRIRWFFGGLFVLGLTFTIGGQRYFHDQYNAYLNVDVSVFASNFTDSVINQLFADIGNYARAKLPAFFVAVAILWIGVGSIRPRRRAARVVYFVAPVFLMASLFLPTQHRHEQASTPDVLYLNAVGGLLLTQLGFTEQSNQLRPRSRESLPVVLEKEPEHRPNVVFLILESVRDDAACVVYDRDCLRTPYSNAVVPDRYPFTQMRSQASSTAISLAVLWAGVDPSESRDVLHTWPLIFDYARAAGYDTAFWTSQNMMFGNARLWVKNLGVSRFVSATELDPVSDLDMGAPEELLAEHVNRHVDDLKEPFLAVVQFSNVHYPYYLDETGPMPFQPASVSKAPENNQAFFNLYLNAVHQQDRWVGSIVRRVREAPFGPRTVVVLTSDHGEAFREHHQMGHTFSVFDEEIHVPAWIDAPPGTVSDEQRRALRSKQDAFLFHSDLAATVIDLMGVWNAREIRRYRERMHGISMLSAEHGRRAVPLTNCAGVWSCAFENWGYMRGPLKIEARSWDRAWHCFDVGADPYEAHDLGVDRCGDLESKAVATFGRLPGSEQ